VRNLSTFSPSQLASQGISADLIVIRPTLAPDGTISDPVAGGSVSDGVFGDRAKVIVPPRVLSQPTAIAIDVLGSPLAIPLPSGFSGAETYFVNIEFFPQPTFPLADPGLMIVLPLRNFISPDTAIQLFRVDSATGKLVPAVNTSGNPVIGHVDSGGMTATFPGLSRLSTLVGLLPSTRDPTLIFRWSSLVRRRWTRRKSIRRHFALQELRSTRIHTATIGSRREMSTATVYWI